MVLVLKVVVRGNRWWCIAMEGKSIRRKSMKDLLRYRLLTIRSLLTSTDNDRTHPVYERSTTFTGFFSLSLSLSFFSFLGQTHARLVHHNLIRLASFDSSSGFNVLMLLSPFSHCFSPLYFRQISSAPACPALKTYELVCPFHVFYRIILVESEWQNHFLM
jgi:hypothetical protein